MRIDIVPANPGFHVLTPRIDVENDWQVSAIDSEPILAWRIETSALHTGGISSSAFPVCAIFDEGLPDCEIYAIEWPDGRISSEPFRWNNREELLAHWQRDPVGLFREARAYARRVAQEAKARQVKQ
jgi:hypothetical protein